MIKEIDGERTATSMHGIPHAFNRRTDNGMQAHVCIQFYISRTYVNNREDPDRQSMVRVASGR